MRQLKQMCSSWLCIISQGQSRVTIFCLFVFGEKYLAICLLPLDWNNVEIHLFARIFLAVRPRKCALCYFSDAHFWTLGFCLVLFVPFSGLLLTHLLNLYPPSNCREILGFSHLDWTLKHFLFLMWEQDSRHSQGKYAHWAASYLFVA